MSQTANPGSRGPSPVALLVDGFNRVDDLVPDIVAGLRIDDLLWRPDTDANSIGWLIWHLTRVQDDHVAGIAGSTQVWLEDGWADRFALPYPAVAIGYGHTSAEVGSFTVGDPRMLTGYWAATFTRTSDVLSELQPDDLARVIDESYEPPVTVATRLVSVLNDITQHVGQASYVRGLLDRRRR